MFKIEIIPSYLTFYYLIVLAIGLILFIGFIIVNFILKGKFEILSFFLTILIPFLSFSFLGLTIGLLTGLSRVPIADIVLPAILTLVSGFIVYLFLDKDCKTESRIQALTAIIVLSFFVMYGSEIGSYSRTENEYYNKKLDHWYSKDLEYYKKTLELESKQIIKKDSIITPK